MDTRGLLSHFFTFTHLRSPAASYGEQALIAGLPIEAHNKWAEMGSIFSVASLFKLSNG